MGILQFTQILHTRSQHKLEWDEKKTQESLSWFLEEAFEELPTSKTAFLLNFLNEFAYRLLWFLYTFYRSKTLPFYTNLRLLLQLFKTPRITYPILTVSLHMT